MKAIDDWLDIPDSLKVENRVPLTPAQQKKLEQVARKAKAKPKPAPKPSAKKAKPVTALRPDGLREGSAGAKLVDFVCRKEGATNEELCEMIGWKQCLPFLKKSCEQAGVKLKTEKEPGERTRYYGMRKAAKK